ncbi:DUF3667 domain-containing protein [Salinibacter ruber]|uniref:DUF3667 domain-containing protein n=1 Tax=Salinibacter ruber TaxID=146919 RepID=UPI002073C671|nr:DUF3667 domain-containing protein [Salinibacter ruber]
MSDALEAQPGDASSGRGVPCQNCGAPLVGEYCHQCGQRHVPELRVLYLVQRFLESALDLEDLERGVGQTLRRAAQNPGRVARRYVDGERKEFVNPLGYFLLTATATFLVFSMFQEAWVQGQAEAFEATWRSLGTRPDEVFRSGSPLRSLGWSSAQDLAAGIFQFFQQVQTYVGLFTCIVAGLLLRWAFPERTAAETLVFELYVTAQAPCSLGCSVHCSSGQLRPTSAFCLFFCRLASTPTAPGRFSERTGELASCPPVPIWQAGSYSSLVPVFSSSGP